jgi:hypothetical protein
VWLYTPYGVAHTLSESPQERAPSAHEMTHQWWATGAPVSDDDDGWDTWSVNVPAIGIRRSLKHSVVLSVRTLGSFMNGVASSRCDKSNGNGRRQQQGLGDGE